MAKILTVSRKSHHPCNEHDSTHETNTYRKYAKKIHKLWADTNIFSAIYFYLCY